MNGVNPPPPPPPPPPGEPVESAPLATLTLTESGKTSPEWTLALHPNHLALLEPSATRPYIIMRDQMMKTATLMESMRAFALEKPVKKIFKLKPEDVTTLADWIGKPVLAALYLRRRYVWVLPISIVWLLGSIPIPGNHPVDSRSFDLLGAVLGLALLGSWACAKWRPHPILFLVDSLWFLSMAGNLIVLVYFGQSKWWLILAGLLLWLVTTGVKHFRRFRGTKIIRHNLHV